jgi:hypothetical protein
MRRSQQSKASSSFLKKRTKKLLSALRGGECMRRPVRTLHWIDVFWFFFSKKNRFLPSPAFKAPPAPS